jgi:hypothetical protein
MAQSITVIQALYRLLRGMSKDPPEQERNPPIAVTDVAQSALCGRASGQQNRYRRRYPCRMEYQATSLNCRQAVRTRWTGSMGIYVQEQPLGGLCIPNPWL